MEPQWLRYSYYTAGSGGAGLTILETSFLLAGEAVGVFSDGKEVILPAISNRREVDFGPGEEGAGGGRGSEEGAGRGRESEEPCIGQQGSLQRQSTSPPTRPPPSYTHCSGTSNPSTHTPLSFYPQAP